jgi:hypothetical protein
MDRVGVIAIQAPVDAFYVLWKSYIFLTFLCSRLLEICKNFVAPDTELKQPQHPHKLRKYLRNHRNRQESWTPCESPQE